jgi:RNA polymerase sigma factor (sigma-70 family)
MGFGEGFQPLLEACRLGEDWAWRDVYEDLAPVLLRYLRARGTREPEDLVGETFLRVVRSVASFEGDERDFRAWVFTIARRLLIDQQRRSARRPSYAMPLEEVVDLREVGDVEEDALRSLAEARVRLVLETLTSDQRDVLTLRILADLTVQQVARVLNKSPGAVKALQARGIEAIRRAMAVGTVTL